MAQSNLRTDGYVYSLPAAAAVASARVSGHARRSSLGRIRRAWRSARSSLVSFELLFILYLFAGRYKAHPALAWLPVDLTALFFGLSVMVGLYVLWRRRFRISRKAFALVLSALPFVAYVLASLAWTPGQVYGSRKALYIATLSFWPLIACAALIARDVRRLTRYLLLLFLLSLWFAIESAWAFAATGRLFNSTVGGSDYLGLARVLCLGALLLFGYGLFLARGPWKRLASFLLFAGYAFLLLVLGARGPFLATIASLLVPLVLGLRCSPVSVFLRRYALPVVGIFIVGFAAGAYLYTSGAATATIARLIRLVEGQDASGLTRWRLYAEAFDLWLQRPLTGHGIGAFGVLAGYGDVRLYPHNLVLEILAELGLAGLLLFGAMIATGLYCLGSLQAIRRDAYRMIVLVLLINVFLNAMFSGDISDNRVVFAMLGLTALPKETNTS